MGRRSARRSARSRSDARRKPSRHLSATSPRLVVILACEGETEERYFKQLFNNVAVLRENVVLHIASAKGSDLASLIRGAKKKRAELGRVGELTTWVICDKDKNDNRDLNRALTWMRGQSSNGVALTNPCIEQWFLTYFDVKPKTLNKCDDYEALLKKELPGYSKRKNAPIPARLLDWDATLQAVDRGWQRLNQVQVPEDSSPAQALRTVWNRDDRSAIPLFFSYLANAVNSRSGRKLIVLHD